MWDAELIRKKMVLDFFSVFNKIKLVKDSIQILRIIMKINANLELIKLSKTLPLVEFNEQKSH